MKVQRLRPDVFTVQQLSGPGQLEELLANMRRTLGSSYQGALAVTRPKRQGTPCGKPKRYQTNAVVWRTDRLSYVKGSRRTWQTNHMSKGHCRDNNQSRSIGLALRLRDKAARRNVAVGTIHWPTGKKDGPPCAGHNAKESVKNLAKTSGASMRIMGGDANTTPGGWYRSVTGRYKFRDAAGAGKWTIKTNGNRRRIDFLFGHVPKGLPLIIQPSTITFDSGDRAAKRVTGHDNGRDPSGNYSDHRAQRALIWY